MPKVPSVPDRQHPRPIRVRVLGHAGTAARTVHDYAHGCMLMRLMQTSVSAVPGTTDPGVLPRDAAGRIPVAIIGATGYVGAELIRLLERHPDVRIQGLAARGRDGLPVGAAFAHLDETGHRIDGALPTSSDVAAVFLALPAGASAPRVPELLARGLAVVDLGPDFRLADPADYPRWYGFEHPALELLPGAGPGAAVYGLPELHRAALAATRLVASPGCYPTAALLALAPLARAGLVADVVVDAKSGVSGAGREPKLETHFSEANENLRAYGLGGHRHLAELAQELRALGAASGVVDAVTFTPHLVPMTRGLLATCYVRPSHPVTAAEISGLYEAAYAGEPFVRLVDAAPGTKHVSGSNAARVHVRLDERSGRIVALAAIDNLVKGAAGQAIQAFNVVAGLPETSGLEQIALYP